MSNNPNEISRRDFMRQSACAALGLTGVVNTMSMLRLANAAVIQSDLPALAADDYKAMVCIFLYGGNDSFNMLVPMGSAASNPVRADYESARVHVGLPSAGLHTLNIPSTTKAFQKHYGGGTFPMGVHPNAEPLATLFNDGDLGFMCNIGTLVNPISSRAQFLSDEIEVPSRLYAHDTQQMHWQTSATNHPGTTGWGGRIADLMHAAYNGDASKASMSMAVGGHNTFQRGALHETLPFVPSIDGTSALAGYGRADYSYALEDGSTFANPTYKDNVEGHRLRGLDRLIQLSNGNLLQDELGQKLVSSRLIEESVGAAMTVAGGTGIDFDGIFNAADANGELGKQLKLIARFISGRSALGNRRQIFFAVARGFDAHGDLIAEHAPLMEELSNSMLAFRNALQTMGDWDKTITFTASDFGRSLAPNTAGTDHAWGGHTMAMGGPVKGGDLYGHFPPIRIGDAPGSLDSRSRGLLIPTTSVDQLSAPIAKWFGADSNSMETIFPNLVRFDDPFTSSTANMQFLV